MTEKEYFAGWYPYIDADAMHLALARIQKDGIFYPKAADVFKAFRLCPVEEACVVLLTQDPYPFEGRATGLAFANPRGTAESNYSPSLKVLMEAAIDYTKPHGIVNFDCTLESWAAQGILLLNSSLTVKPKKPGSHALCWTAFTSAFLRKFSETHPGTAYMLLGRAAQSFGHCIRNGKIFEASHPAAYSRKGERMPSRIFNDVRAYVKEAFGKDLRWYEEQ